jgi:hypothetical protein
VREPSRRVRITELDPKAKCGAGTTVARLYRVEERVGDGRATHLVFNDRHGWYCQHGPACPAVNDVRRHVGRRPIGAAPKPPARPVRGA